jgi:hypothetical protein
VRVISVESGAEKAPSRNVGINYSLVDKPASKILSNLSIIL